MKISVSALSGLTNDKERFSDLIQLQNRLEIMTTPHIIHSLQNKLIDNLKLYVEIFISIDKNEVIQNIYMKFILEQLENTIKKYINNGEKKI
jgi:hypothetical protein